MSLSNRGAFTPYRLSYEGRSALKQAEMILNRVRELKNQKVQKFSKVGIIYSANDEQAQSIVSAYRANNNNWANTNNKGSNQGEVIGHIERLLLTPAYSELQDTFVIFPIATMSYERKDLDQEEVAKTLVNRDMRFIEEHLNKGAAVLGWQNQLTGPGRFAVGGGVSTNPLIPKNTKLSQTHLDNIQSHLSDFQLNYPDRTAAPIQPALTQADPKPLATKSVVTQKTPKPQLKASVSSLLAVLVSGAALITGLVLLASNPLGWGLIIGGALGLLITGSLVLRKRFGASAKRRASLANPLQFLHERTEAKDDFCPQQLVNPYPSLPPRVSCLRVLGNGAKAPVLDQNLGEVFVDVSNGPAIK